ncbi:MAG: HU family DNA-binding protein [Alphaproteobacteria bacterium]|nr:HU family DNA-binding protein [Alphaproteobacteria bacterium]NCQ67358.1 HU family DNA-binding protein [Alphaproteobacteria bacterium]NCT06675.1 HU family DNA-binding protein [Alphaproteobacteria bacterium]
MTKADLISAIANETGFSKKDSETALGSILGAITNSLQKGNEVRLVGFGTFKVSDRAARTGRNPRTGESIQIKASKVPTFKAGKELKDAVN